MCWNLLPVLAWQLWDRDAYSRRSHFICGYLVRSFLVVPCQYPGFALSVPWLSSASSFNDLWTSNYLSCDDSSYSRGVGGLVIFLMILWTKVYFFREQEVFPWKPLLFLSFVWLSPPLASTWSDPWCWLLFWEYSLLSGT